MFSYKSIFEEEVTLTNFQSAFLLEFLMLVAVFSTVPWGNSTLIMNATPATTHAKNAKEMDPITALPVE